MAKRVYLSTLLKRMGACDGAVEWARSRRGMPGGLRATFEACPSWLWLVWLFQRIGLRDEEIRAWRQVVADEYIGAVDTYRGAVPFERVREALERKAAER